jgi:hypothetical protein
MCPPRSWCGCVRGAVSTPTRHHVLRPARAAGHAVMAPSTTPATQAPGRRRAAGTSKTTASMVACTYRPGPGCIPSNNCTPPEEPSSRARSCAAPWSASRSSACRPTPAHPRCCGCGGKVRHPGSRDAVARLRAPLRPGAHHPLRQADPRLGHPAAPSSRAGRPLDLAGCWPPTPSCAWPAGWPVTGGYRGSDPAHRGRLTPGRVRRGFPQLLAALGSPACAPKPCGRSPGRPRGSQSGPAVRHPTIKKAA